MKRCLTCNTTYEQVYQPDAEHCPKCGTQVVYTKGMQVYAPESTDASEGFKAEYFDELAQVEEYSFWFRARNRIITWAFAKYAHPIGKVLE